MRLKGSDGARIRARVARRAMSAAEVALWWELRKSPGGSYFRRQHPAGIYDLDFNCAPAALAIEVDGAFHDRGDQPERDAIREAWVAEQGVLTLRFSAQDVFRRLEAVLDHIVSVARSRRPPSTI